MKVNRCYCHILDLISTSVVVKINEHNRMVLRALWLIRDYVVKQDHVLVSVFSQLWRHNKRIMISSGQKWIFVQLTWNYRAVHFWLIVHILRPLNSSRYWATCRPCPLLVVLSHLHWTRIPRFPALAPSFCFSEFFLSLLHLFFSKLPFNFN